jgi:hypothetical protein
MKRVQTLKLLGRTLLGLLLGLGSFVLTQSVANAGTPTPLNKIQAELSASARLTSLPTHVIPPGNQWEDLWKNDFGAIATGGERSTCWNYTQSSSSLPTCVFGDPKATRTLVLTGDSQAYMWEPAFDEWGKSNSWRVIVLTKGACQPWPDSHQEFINNSAFPTCGTFQTKVRKYINTTHPSLVVAAGLMPTVPNPSIPLAITDVANFVTSIAPSGARVLIVAPSPSFYTYDSVAHSTLSAPTCLTLHPQQLLDCNGIPLRLLTNYFMDIAINKSPLPDKSHLLNLTQLLCNTKCPMIADGILIYIEPNHISYDWAVHVSSALGQILAPLLKGL